MDPTLLEQLLYEDESATLDFKKEQYKFAKANDDEKSELLKDILGFANGWRRSDAYILVGVEEVRGGRSNVVGVTDHLSDHSLQQFVSNLTNRPVRFGYEVCPLDGKQVGVIRLDMHQQRPIHLKKDFGKLKRDMVYMRRGSSIDPTRPATPDELVQMGMGLNASSPEAELAVEFADPERELALGARIQLSAEFCHMPPLAEIPNRPRYRASNPFGIDLSALEGITGDVLNAQYYRQIANCEFARRLFRRIRLVVTNKGKVAASNVRIELIVPKGERVVISAPSEMPTRPKRKRSRFDVIQSSMLKKIRPIVRRAGNVDIDVDDDRCKVEIECENLQPGRIVWSESFYIGIGATGEFFLRGNSFATNLSKPEPFTLTIDATVSETAMTVDELIEFADREKSEIADRADG